MITLKCPLYHAADFVSFAVCFVGVTSGITPFVAVKELFGDTIGNLPWYLPRGTCIRLRNINWQDWKYTSFVVFVGYI